MKFVYILLILTLSGFIGTVIGEFVIFFVPQTFPYYQFLALKLNPVFKVNQIDFIIFDLSFNLKFNVNIFTLFGLIMGSLFALKKV